MKESWLCRNYQSGDEYQILALYKQVTNREMGLDYWKWRYVENPFGEGLIKLLFDKERLIGHRGAIPVLVSIRGKPVRAAIILNTITHPDYQRQGISTYLAYELYKEAKARGISFIYNFPNENSYPLYLRIEGWKELDRRSILQKRIETRPASGALPHTDIYQIERFDDEVNLLWDRVRDDFCVIVPRVKELLNWRFVQHPTVTYPKYVITGKQGEVLGYIVLKIYSRVGETTGHVIDMLSIGDKTVVKGLLECAYDYFIRAGISEISCWMPDNCFYSGVLKAEGFTRRMMETHFGLKILDEQNELLQMVNSVHNWYLTMGDSDVF